MTTGDLLAMVATIGGVVGFIGLIVAIYLRLRERVSVGVEIDVARFASEVQRRIDGPGLRPFEIFGSCPGCKALGYHLLSAPRTVTTPKASNLWVTEFEVQVWGRPETYRVARGRDTVRRPVTVIDRECLSCGKTWTEES